MQTTERRAAAGLTLDGRRLRGHAAVFGVEATIADFLETVQPGAFAGSLARGDDVLALVDHDPKQLLGRTRSKTLALSEDARGLAFEIAVPDTALARDVLALVERGDVGGASFGFRVPKGGDRWHGRSRTLVQVDLVDISIIHAHPAYPTTDVSARSRQAPRLSLALARRFLEGIR